MGKFLHIYITFVIGCFFGYLIFSTISQSEHIQKTDSNLIEPTAAKQKNQVVHYKKTSADDELKNAFRAMVKTECPATTNSVENYKNSQPSQINRNEEINNIDSRYNNDGDIIDRSPASEEEHELSSEFLDAVETKKYEEAE